MASGQAHAEVTTDISPTLTCLHEQPIVALPQRLSSPDGYIARRFTPLEYERLMGFPDGYTAVRNAKGRISDAPRYRALGNSMAVNVIRWIGDRIAMVEGCV